MSDNTSRKSTTAWYFLYVTSNWNFHVVNYHGFMHNGCYSYISKSLTRTPTTHSLSLSLSLQFYDIAFHVLFTLHDNHAMFSLDCLKFLLSRSFFLVLFARFLRVYFPNISTVRDIIMRANTVVKLVAKIDTKLVLFGETK